MFKWYPLLYDEKRGRDVLNDKQTELSGGARMTKNELDNVLADHRLWLDRDGGKRADLRLADLRGADLQEALAFGRKTIEIEVVK